MDETKALSFVVIIYYDIFKVRGISLHEFQSKLLLEENGVNVQRFRIASNLEEVKVAGTALSNTTLHLCQQTTLLYAMNLFPSEHNR
jgi:hypothetical protein